MQCILCGTFIPFPYYHPALLCIPRGVLHILQDLTSATMVWQNSTCLFHLTILLKSCMQFNPLCFPYPQGQKLPCPHHQWKPQKYFFYMLLCMYSLYFNKSDTLRSRTTIIYRCMDEWKILIYVLKFNEEPSKGRYFLTFWTHGAYIIWRQDKVLKS